MLQAVAGHVAEDEEVVGIERHSCFHVLEGARVIADEKVIRGAPDVRLCAVGREPNAVAAGVAEQRQAGFEVSIAFEQAHAIHAG